MSPARPSAPFLLLTAAALAAAVLVVAGCDRKSDGHEVPATATSAPSASASAAPVFDSGALAASPATKAAQIYATRCTGCHGVHGKGDGPLSKALQPPPRDYSDPVWQKATTDDDLRAVIAGGGAAVHKSPNMPASPDLADDPPTLTAMVTIVRSFASAK